MKKTAFAWGLTMVFGLSAAAGAQPKVNETLCIAIVNPVAHQTACEYRKPKIHRFVVDNGRVLTFNGASILKSGPLAGVDAALCDAHFEDAQKIHGPCRKIVW